MVVLAGVAAAILAGCGARAVPSAMPARSTIRPVPVGDGVVTGRAWPCVGMVLAGVKERAVVSVFSGTQPVAVRNVAPGATFRIPVPPGLYLVTNNGLGTTVPGTYAQVSVSSGSTIPVELSGQCP